MNSFRSKSWVRDCLALLICSGGDVHENN